MRKLIKINAVYLFVLYAGMASLAWGQASAGTKIETVNSVGDRYSISLEPITIAGFTGLHSFATAQHEGKWLLIGGRTDGLHRRQPFASFAANGNNLNIF